MRTTCDFLDSVKQRYVIVSDYKLAKFIGVTQSCISNYRNGRSNLDDSTALKVAHLLEIDPAEVISAVHAERAKRPEERAVWVGIWERLQKVAAVAVIGSTGLAAIPSHSEAAPIAGAENGCSVYYVK